MMILVKVDPNRTSRDLQTYLGSSGTHVHASTIRRKLKSALLTWNGWSEEADESKILLEVKVVKVNSAFHQKNLL